VLVSDVDTLPKDTPEFKAMLSGFAYAPGSTYAEWKDGDKVAAVGLGALVLGGAGAAAAKKGFFTAALVMLAKFWKLIAMAVVGVFFGLSKIFKKKEA
jgi:uncharacterized membrane-anchored protein